MGGLGGPERDWDVTLTASRVEKVSWGRRVADQERKQGDPFVSSRPLLSRGAMKVFEFGWGHCLELVGRAQASFVPCCSHIPKLPLRCPIIGEDTAFTGLKEAQALKAKSSATRDSERRNHCVGVGGEAYGEPSSRKNVSCS